MDGDAQTSLDLSTPDPAPADESATLRAALEEARRDRAALVTENTTLRSQRDDTSRRLSTESSQRFVAEESSIDNAIAAATNEADGLEGEYARLLGEGKTADAAKVMRKMTAAEAKIQQLTAKKEWFAQEKERTKDQPVQHADPFDQFVGGYPQNVQGWIRQNRRFYTDERYRNAVTGAAHLAMNKGIQPGTTDYFRFCEEQGEAALRGDDVAATRTAQIEEPAGEDHDVTIEQHKTIAPDARPVQPQPRAAGPGSLASVASRPTRATPGTVSRTRPTLTAEEADMANTLASTLAPELTNPADIYKWYYDYKTGPAAARLRQKWAAAG
jgi:hypothetical protein